MWELRSKHPMLDMRFFENPRFSAASGAITLVFLALFGTLFLITQYLQSVLGYSTVKAGAVLLAAGGDDHDVRPLVERLGAALRQQDRRDHRIAARHDVRCCSFRTLQPNSGVLHIILITMLMGLGMANVMAPCTDSIMGSLPRAKAGVGSAVNDTTRQMGGAIGVAVFGSLMASHFTKAMADNLSGVVPADVLSRLGDNVGQAIERGTQRRRLRQRRIIDTAKSSFVSGLHTVGLVAAGVVFLAAVGVALFLPARARDDDVVVPSTVYAEPEPVSSSSLDQRPGPGRPRDPACDAAILDAALDAFVEHGYRGMSIEGVAARAGVAKATVYRRYSSKAKLVVDAFRHRLQFVEYLPDTGDLRADLLAMLEPLVERLRGRDGPILVAFTTERLREPELAEEYDRSVIGRKRVHMRKLVRDAVERGDLPRRHRCRSPGRDGARPRLAPGAQPPSRRAEPGRADRRPDRPPTTALMPASQLLDVHTTRIQQRRMAGYETPDHHRSSAHRASGGR